MNVFDTLIEISERIRPYGFKREANKLRDIAESIQVPKSSVTALEREALLRDHVHGLDEELARLKTLLGMYL